MSMLHLFHREIMLHVYTLNDQKKNNFSFKRIRPSSDVGLSTLLAVRKQFHSYLDLVKDSK